MRRSGTTLRSKLILLLLGTTLPLLVMALANAWISYRAERERLDRSTEAVARGVALGVALEVQRGLAGLNALALSRPLCTGDLRTFRQQLERFRDSQHPGANALLSDGQGQQLVNLLAKPGQALPARRNLDLVQDTFNRGRPVVSNVYSGTFQDRVVSLEVAVHCDGQARYNLALVPRLEVFRSVLMQQRQGDDWTLMLLDGKGEVIASTGTSPILTAAARSLADGEERTLDEGWPPSAAGAALAYSRVGDSGWGILIKRPLEGVRSALARSVVILLLTGLLLVLFGGAFALSVARSLVRPMERLANLARQGDDAGAAELPESGVREVDAVAARLQEAMRELRLADQRRNDFVSTLAHELRNPLAPLTNAMELLRRQESLSPAGARMTDVAQRQLQQVKRLVDDMLELARLGQGKLSLELREMDLRDALRAAVDVVAARFDERSQSLDARLPPEPLHVLADETRLVQVFSNLLDNASKYSLPGGHVRIEAAVRGGRIVVDVGDDGQGLDPREAARVFDMYWQAGSSPGRGGLGIGLALVRRLVEAHGGGVQAASPGPGQGSTFTVWLPMRRPAS